MHQFNVFGGFALGITLAIWGLGLIYDPWA